MEDGDDDGKIVGDQSSEDEGDNEGMIRSGRGKEGRGGLLGNRA